MLIDVSCDREREVNGGALARHARELNLATMHLDDLATDARAESMGVSAGLGGESPIEHARDEIGWNAAPGIRDLAVHTSSCSVRDVLRVCDDLDPSTLLH